MNIDPTSSVSILEQALNLALLDERRAAATYQGVVDQFGAINPFFNILQAERRHVDVVSMLFNRYGFAIPADPYEVPVAPLPTIEENCALGVEAEIANGALYEYLLGYVEEPDVRDVFMQLQSVALGNHLPAFERCLERSNISAMIGNVQQFMSNPTKGGIVDLMTGNNSTFLMGAIAGAAALWLLDEYKSKKGGKDD